MRDFVEALGMPFAGIMDRLAVPAAPVRQGDEAAIAGTERVLLP